MVDVKSVDAATVKTWLDRNEIVLVDVRETKEFEVEHIAGALLLPLSSFDPEVFPTIPGKQLVLHCAIGKRSEAAGKMLINEGHENVVHMEGGLGAWKAEGFATEVQILPPDEEPEAPVFLCPTPGQVLKDEFLDPLKVTPDELALRLHLTGEVVGKLLAGDIPVDVELSLRLARFFSTAADFWMHLQLEHDMERARHAMGEKIRKEIRPRAS